MRRNGSTRYDDHIAPINRLVDELSKWGYGWLPYVAPMYGGVNASVLSLLRDPGPKTQTDRGSGFICMENDDATAETISRYFAEAGISAHNVVPWNAYPWYINRNPSASELNVGVEALRRLIELLPRLRVVMLHGGVARNACKRLATRYGSLLYGRDLHVLATYHTSRQAFWHRDPAVRQARKEHLRNAFAEAAQLLSGFDAPTI